MTGRRAVSDGFAGRAFLLISALTVFLTFAVGIAANVGEGSMASVDGFPEIPNSELVWSNFSANDGFGAMRWRVRLTIGEAVSFFQRQLAPRFRTTALIESGTVARFELIDSEGIWGRGRLLIESTVANPDELTLTLYLGVSEASKSRHFGRAPAESIDRAAVDAVRKTGTPFPTDGNIESANLLDIANAKWALVEFALPGRGEQAMEDYLRLLEGVGWRLGNLTRSDSRITVDFANDPVVGKAFLDASARAHVAITILVKVQ